MYTEGDVREIVARAVRRSIVRCAAAQFPNGVHNWTIDPDGIVNGVMADTMSPSRIDYGRDNANEVPYAHDCGGETCPTCLAWRLRNHGGGAD
jgi:hypothetical protein